VHTSSLLCDERCARWRSGDCLLCTPVGNCVTRCAQIYSSGELLCTPAKRAIGGVHKRAERRRLCTPPDNHAIGGVHKGAQGIAGCAHCQTIMRRPVCTNLLQQRAIVHTSQLCDERCAQRRSRDRRLCTPAKRTMSGVHKGAQELIVVHTSSQLCDDWCAQIYSSGELLCTPANRAIGGVHKGTERIDGCAHHQTIVRRPMCTNPLQQWAIVHKVIPAMGYCAHSPISC
jgi:hypothetical protein